ncbi:MAG: glycosyltransferase family 4 protein [Chitinivibrionia bacterium]|jgi:glycosyltransferase involved in cell wall biosynthesis|nr:glycosyltransferase family 4 protein [Chitinivibrionia bacterium]
MKIAFISTLDSSDVNAWSGSIYYISQTLREIGEVAIIDKLFAKRSKAERAFAKICRLFWKFLGKRYIGEQTIRVAKFYAKQIENQLPSDVDVVFSHDSIVLAYLKTDKLKVLYTDVAEFCGMLNYYPGYYNLSPQTIKIATKMEEATLNNCNLVLYSSEWAANGAKNNYKINDPNKIKVVPFGANIECGRTKNNIAEIIESKEKNKCNLLFIGVDWERKGGDIALETAKNLYEKGVSVRLDIIGIKDCPVELPNYVKNHGFVSKSTAAGKKKIDNLFEKAHFLILPTRAECFGVVFCEASSFGLPSLTTKTGGVASAVLDNKNGKLFERTDNGEKYAEYIQAMLADYENYKKLCFSSFEQYETRLNWKVAGERIFEYIEKLRKK